MAIIIGYSKGNGLNNFLFSYIINHSKNENEVLTISRTRKGTMIDKIIESKYLKESIPLRIYQPENFSPLYKYHICIAHDGNDYYNLGRLATVSDKLHENVEITDTVFVGIHYIDRFDRLKKYHPDGELHEAYTKFLIHEVVPFLDDYLPSYHMGHSRCLMGDSLAGTLSLLMAVQYPHTFGKVIMQSPFVNDTVLKIVKASKQMDVLEIYHTIGTAELEVPMSDGQIADFLAPNRKLNKLLESMPSEYTYKELDQGLHTWKYWQKDLPQALTTLLV